VDVVDLMHANEDAMAAGLLDKKRKVAESMQGRDPQSMVLLVKIEMETMFAPLVFVFLGCEESCSSFCHALHFFCFLAKRKTIFPIDFFLSHALKLGYRQVGVSCYCHCHDDDHDDDDDIHVGVESDRDSSNESGTFFVPS